MNQQARDILTKARIALIMEQPFFGTLALRLQLVEDLTCKTLWVDGERMGYNPQFVIELEQKSAGLPKSAVAHEVGHCVFEHITRRGSRSPKKWNCAGDYVINLTLQDSGFEIGQDWLINPAYANMTADHIYNLIPDPPEDGSGGGGPGDPGGPLDEIRDGKPGDSTKAGEWKVAAAQAANSARMAGKLPANLARFVNELLNPKADWRTVLRRFITEENKNDYSWMRPNKRFIHAGYYIPTLYDHGMGEVVIAIDTSASITQQMLDVFGAEIQAIRDSVQPRMTRVIYCDSRVNHVDEFAREDLLELKMYGGGGTDFRPPFALIEKEGWTPAAFLYLTDLEGQAPAEPPDYPVIWCCTTEHEAPWGERVEIEV